MRRAFHFQRLKPVRFALAAFSLVSLTIQPVAFGQNQEQWANKAIKEFVKQNRRGKKPITVKEFWEQNRKYLDPEWQNQFFPAINIEQNEPMPEMDLVTVRGAGGKEIQRLLLTFKNKKTVSIEYIGGTDKFARINNEIISYEDFYSGTGIVGKIAKDPVAQFQEKEIKKKALERPLLPSFEVFAQMTPMQRAEYFLALRYALDEVENVMALMQKKVESESASFIQLLIEKAHAKTNVCLKAGWRGTCIVAGYVGTYKSTDTQCYCDHESGNQKLSRQNGISSNMKSSLGDCGGGQVACNPFIFGYNRSNNSPLCIKVDRTRGSGFQQATSECHKKSPLNSPADTAAMLKTMLAKNSKTGEFFNTEGKYLREKFEELQNTVIKDFNSVLEQALNECKNNAGKPGEAGQASACAALEQRKLNLVQAEVPAPVNPPVAAPTSPSSGDPTEDPCKKNEPPQAGATTVPCPAGTTPPQPVTKCDSGEPYRGADGRMKCPDPVRAEPIAGGETSRRGRKEKNDFPWNIVAPIGIMALFGFAAYKMTQSNQRNRPGTYVPPAPPPGLPTPPPPPMVTPVPPISPILPMPTPAGGETAPGAQPGGPSGMGTR